MVVLCKSVAHLVYTENISFLDSVHIYGNVLLQERTHSRLIGRI